MRQKQKNTWRYTAVRLHFLFALLILSVYIAASFFYSPEFLISSLKGKAIAFADDIVVTATVLGAPVQPVVSGNAQCIDGSLSVSLDWADDVNSTSYDVERNGPPLVSGILSSAYQDTFVAVGTSYTYVVIAHGPMGSGMAVSDPFVVTTPSQCANILPAPTVALTAFDGRGISGTMRTTEQRPLFEGTSNIPGAIIALQINGVTTVQAQVTTNVNGYWSWRPSVNISYGAHTLFFTATDPNDTNRQVSASFDFLIAKEKTESSSKTSKENSSPISVSHSTVGVSSPTVKVPSVGVPLDFSLSLGRGSVLQGDRLPVEVFTKRLSGEYENTNAILRFSIVDEDGVERVVEFQDIVLTKEGVYGSSLLIPGYMKKGRYAVVAQIRFGSYDVAREQEFLVLPRPVLNLGGGMVLTYPDVLDRLGDVAFLLFLLLLLWIFAFSKEYLLYLRSWRHITERHLQKLGFFGKRKGVGV